MIRGAAIYLGRGHSDTIWLATLYSIRRERVSILVKSLDPGRDMLEATDLGAYLAGVTDLVDAWVDHGYGTIGTPYDGAPPPVCPTYGITYAAGRVWVRSRGTGPWERATTGRAGPPETRESLRRVLDGFAGVSGDACEVLLFEDDCR